jgi:hypothetical protein
VFRATARGAIRVTPRHMHAGGAITSACAVLRRFFALFAVHAPTALRVRKFGTQPVPGRNVPRGSPLGSLGSFGFGGTSCRGLQSCLPPLRVGLQGARRSGGNTFRIDKRQVIEVRPVCPPLSVVTISPNFSNSRSAYRTARARSTSSASHERLRRTAKRSRSSSVRCQRARASPAVRHPSIRSAPRPSQVRDCSPRSTISHVDPLTVGQPPDRSRGCGGAFC